MLQRELSLIDDISAKHFLDMRVLIRRNIPKEFVRPWNSLLVPLMASINSDHGMKSGDLLDGQGMPTPSTCNARKFKLLWILPRLMWHIPCRRINGKVRYEGMLSFKPAIRRRFKLASEGNFSELYRIYLRNVDDFTQFRVDHLVCPAGPRRIVFVRL